MTPGGESTAPNGSPHRTAERARVLLSIGEVLVQLRTDFPDVTISKLRFLEAEGLVEPLRTQAGYRKYSPADITRLRYILTAQRDHYLPLRVIREQLAAMEHGNAVPVAAGAPGGWASGPGAGHAPLAVVGADPGVDPDEAVRLDRTALCARAGLDEGALVELEQHGLLSAGPEGWYDADALTVARLAAALAEYGLQPRHLRAYRVAADRELGLLNQLIAPLMHQSSPQSRAKAAEVSRELVMLTQRLQAVLVRVGLRSALGR